MGNSISRRNSSEAVPKCDNITKYPDKKQIEDKLNQIREYLHITSTLMSNMKNSETQVSCIDIVDVTVTLYVLLYSVVIVKSNN